jgi:hypothetical protein
MSPSGGSRHEAPGDDGSLEGVFHGQGGQEDGWLLQTCARQALLFVFLQPSLDI